ncbi:MAG: 50S ribosomal protein L13 [Myxococcota bacterium]|jgi:large subunit ribosomal protein L13|nr:50S ribosomal protein L13 [Myxococcota bacterium]
MATQSTKASEVTHDWFVVDAEGQTLGRMATRIATVLRGKHKVTFTPHVDTGDYVIVINADKVALSGDKMDSKKYYRYTGYFGGLKSKTAREVVATEPERLVTQAVKGMLPKNRLSRQVIKKLKVYAGSEHPHEGQQPKPFPETV